MLAKVITGNSGWDVVFPTHSRIEPMRANGLLAPLRHEWLPGLAHLDPRFRAPAWDPALEWGVPYMWNGTGIVYNRAAAARRPRVGPTCGAPRLKGRLTMLDDPEDMLGACLKKLGLPFSATAPAQLHARRTGGHRAEAAAARLHQRRGARPAGGRRCAGRAALVHHRAAGHRRRAAAGLRLSGRGLSVLLRLRRHPARKPPHADWRTSSWITCCAPPSPRRSWNPRAPPPPTGPRSIFCPSRSGITPSLYPPREIFDRGEWPRTSIPPRSACATASGRKSNRHKLQLTAAVCSILNSQPTV